MEKQNFVKRFVVPTGIVFFTWLLTTVIYYNSRKIGNDTLQQIVADISAVLLFASIGFGPLLIYPFTYFRGAGLAERIIACLVTPVAWDIKEIVRVTEFFSAGESIFYGFNQVFLLAMFGASAQMGLCEMICRWRLNKRGEERLRVVTPVPVVSILVGLAAFYVILLWGVGVHFFYAYMEVYKALFH